MNAHQHCGKSVRVGRELPFLRAVSPPRPQEPRTVGTLHDRTAFLAARQVVREGPRSAPFYRGSRHGAVP